MKLPKLPHMFHDYTKWTNLAVINSKRLMGGFQQMEQHRTCRVCNKSQMRQI